MVPQNNYKNNTKDHQSQIIVANMIIMEKFKYYNNYQNGTQRHEVSKCGWKNGTNTLALHRITTNL